MNVWRPGRRGAAGEGLSTEERIRSKYQSFRSVLSLNNECLELMAGLQEDLQFVPPRRDVLGARVGTICDKAEQIVSTLEGLMGKPSPILSGAVRAQRREVETYIAGLQELVPRRLSAWLNELDTAHGEEAGGKAAALGEVRNRLGLPVPDGYVLTTEAYRQFCGLPLWREIRDAVRELDPSDLDALREASRSLTEKIMAAPVPRAVEVALTERAKVLAGAGLGLAVRSSAVGEGGDHTFAGQFLSLINVPADGLVEAYKRVVASRFSERALFYRLSAGLSEVDSPMAVLVLPTLRARAAGILYTRDPRNPRSSQLWVTATPGLGLDMASGRTSADLYLVSRSRTHAVLERRLVQKEAILVPDPQGGVVRRPVDPAEGASPSLNTEELQVLARWGVLIEEHFGSPQDVEWVLDEEGGVWIVQARPLALAEEEAGHGRARARGEPLIEGGQTIYPGRISGQAYLVRDLQDLGRTPEGAVLLLHRPTPEVVKVMPRLSGLVAEWGNVAGHGAALLREFKVPSVFGMKGLFEKVRPGDLVSLDAVQARIYPGDLWPRKLMEAQVPERYRGKGGDPISRRLLTLNLLDPAAFNFRPRGCRSTHDVLRYAHEKAIEAMFSIHDTAFESGPHASKKLIAPIPVNLYVLDLGGGLELENPARRQVMPAEITSRPFRAIWAGISHPRVTWSRSMPASLGGIASVLAGSFASHGDARRALGEKSYLLVADEYMNLNSRLAYHFTLVDACVSEVANHNYISFRFAGGGATRRRRNLRACFLEACLSKNGFQVDRRGDVVNAWLKKAPAGETEAKLDVLGRLMACASQLDMYMTGEEAMRWYVEQFLQGNYGFAVPDGGEGGA